LAASRQWGHAGGADLVAAFRAEQRPLTSVPWPQQRHWDRPQFRLLGQTWGDVVARVV